MAAEQPEEKDPLELLKLEKVRQTGHQFCSLLCMMHTTIEAIHMIPGLIAATSDGHQGWTFISAPQALSDRSTCRATGEKIKKGEWRVGIEAWRAGRNSMTWQVQHVSISWLCLSFMNYFPRSVASPILQRSLDFALQ